MKMNRARSVEDFRLVGRFSQLCKTLEAPDFADCRSRPLSFWALANDRRLPFALLDRTIDDLIRMSYADLAATPGVGAKKITTLLTLLERAASDPASPPKNTLADQQESPKRVNRRRQSSGANSDNGFHPGDVSESLWTRWKASIEAHGLQHERLGRLAPSLGALPSVLWDVPLSYYLGMSAAEVQQLKSHGPKRVRAVFETVHRVCRLLAESADVGGLSARPRPAFIDAPEACLLAVIETQQSPTAEQVIEQVSRPLAEQIRLDLGDPLGELAEDRLCVRGPSTPVKAYAKRLSVTRARVYQLLEDCAAVMAIRWPEGRSHFAAVRVVLEDPTLRGPARDLLLAAGGLAFPERKSRPSIRTADAASEQLAASCA